MKKSTFILATLIGLSMIAKAQSEIRGITIDGDYAYVRGGGGAWYCEESFLHIYDIANPPGYSLSGSISDSICAEELVYYDGTIFASGSFTYWELKIIDVVNPLEPFVLGRYNGDWWRGRDIVIFDSIAYFLWSTCEYETAYGSLDVLDISDRTSPQLIVPLGINQNCALDMAVARDGYLYVVGGDAYGQGGRLSLVVYFDIFNPTLMFTNNLADAAVGIAVAANHLFIIDVDELLVYDVVNPGNPVYVTRLAIPSPRDIIIDGNLAMIAADTFGVYMIDIGDPGSPVVNRIIDTPGAANCLAAQANYLYVGVEDSLMVYDINLLGTEDVPSVPRRESILSCYPNPFNGSTIISYALSQRSHIDISIYDIAGRKIAKLTDLVQDAGDYQTVWDAAEMPSGVYLARLEAAGTRQTVRLILQK